MIKIFAKTPYTDEREYYINDNYISYCSVSNRELVLVGGASFLFTDKEWKAFEKQIGMA